MRPSSVDVRLDRFFQVFQNSRYTHIDPMLQQDERRGFRRTATTRSYYTRASSVTWRRTSRRSDFRMILRAG
jgi:deoxycytidine triphosphate deaminase